MSGGVVVLLVIAAVIALAVFRSRYNRWAARQRAAGRETAWTRNIGTGGAGYRGSRAARVATYIGVPSACAAIIAGLIVDGTADLVLTAGAVAVLVGVIAMRFRVP